MNSRASKSRSRTERRSFIKHGMLAASGATVGLGLLGNGKFAFGDDQGELDGPVTNGDAAILRFLAAAEILETDLWLQYAELGGTQDNLLRGVPTGGSAPYAPVGLQKPS